MSRTQAVGNSDNSSPPAPPRPFQPRRRLFAGLMIAFAFWVGFLVLLNYLG